LIDPVVRADDPTFFAQGRPAYGALPIGLALSAVGLLLLAVIAFWPQYLSKFSTANAYTHVHAVLGALWLSVLIAQPLLIRARRLRLHRFIGRSACLIGGAFVLSGVLLAHYSAGRMSDEDFAREGFSLYLPLVMALIFATAVTLGVAWRRVPAVHARFMACSALPLLDPVFARILFFYFPPLPALPLHQMPAFVMVGAILFLLWRTLPARAPGRRAFRDFGVFVMLAFAAFFATPYSDAWFGFVHWFRSI
jgi:hypothetical protein